MDHAPFSSSLSGHWVVLCRTLLPWSVTEGRLCLHVCSWCLFGHLPRVQETRLLETAEPRALCPFLPGPSVSTELLWCHLLWGARTSAGSLLPPAQVLCKAGCVTASGHKSSPVDLVCSVYSGYLLTRGRALGTCLGLKGFPARGSAQAN